MMMIMMMMATIDEKSNTSESQQLQVLCIDQVYILRFIFTPGGALAGDILKAIWLVRRSSENL